MCGDALFPVKNKQETSVNGSHTEHKKVSPGLLASLFPRVCNFILPRPMFEMQVASVCSQAAIVRLQVAYAHTQAAFQDSRSRKGSAHTAATALPRGGGLFPSVRRARTFYWLAKF